MIKTLSIKNFKSIKNLEMDCRKINLFIGEPNVGKSNMLEAIGLFSWCGNAYGNNLELEEYVRFHTMQNLFYDNLIDESVEIKVEGNVEASIEMKFANNRFCLEATTIDTTNTKLESTQDFNFDYSGKFLSTDNQTFPVVSEISFIKFYRFMVLTQFPDIRASFLTPPHGSNMFSVIMGHKNLREIVSKLLRDYGFRLVLKPMERVL